MDKIDTTKDTRGKAEKSWLGKRDVMRDLIM